MSATPFRQVADDFFVAPQLLAADFAAARAAGIRTIINNRPDGEAPDQLQRRRGARAGGGERARLRLRAGGVGADGPGRRGGVQGGDRRASRPAISPTAAPGTRSCHMWAFATAGARPVDETIAAAAAAGYDLAPTRPILERLAGG